jgi:hypothetical protein
VSPDVLHQLADALNELMLPSNRGRLSAPVIATASVPGPEPGPGQPKVNE